MYKCLNCDNRFEEATDTELGLNICPECKDIDICEITKCDICGEYIEEDFNDHCDSCLLEAQKTLESLSDKMKCSYSDAIALISNYIEKRSL